MCVVPEPGACSASQELPSRYDAPKTCTVHVVMHSQLRWRARAHGADGRTSAATFGGLVFFSAVCVGALRRSGARPCERFLRVGATDAFGNAHDALGAPRMRRSDAGDAHMCDGSHFWPFMARISRKRPLPDIDPNPSMLYSNRANIYLPRHLTTIFEIKIKESKGFQVHKDSQQSRA